MFITPKKRLMSITNALATHKYNAYSTTIDLEKAKVEEDGTILAGSPYPFSNKVEFPVKNYVLDSQYKNSEFIMLMYNSNNTQVNCFYDKFSIIKQNNDSYSVIPSIIEGSLKLKIKNNTNAELNTQTVLVQDLVEPVRLNKPMIRTINYTTSKRVRKVSLGYTISPNRGVDGATQFYSLSNASYKDNIAQLSMTDIHRFNSTTNNIAYGIMINLEITLLAEEEVTVTFNEFMVTDGNEVTEYYPAVEDFPAGSGEVAQGLMFNDINVKEQQEKGINVITGKLITSGYVLEDRLPYPIDDASKENLKMIRFR